MKKTICVLLILAFVFSFVSLLPQTVFAETYSGTCGDNLTWSFDPESGTLTISGTGAMNDIFNAPWNLYVSSITSVEISYGITSIGARAFYGCSSLTSVTIPSSILSIKHFAFFGCSSLNAVYITDISAWCGITFWHDSSNPLYFAKNLYINGEIATDLVIPNSVESIGNFAFIGSGLTNVTIPDSVTSIGCYAFQNCSSLKNVTIPASVTKVRNEAFSGCSSLEFRIYNNAKYLGDSNNPYYALIEATDRNITSCIIHKNTKLIAEYAFCYCSFLENVTVPDSVIIIGDLAFYNCTSLKSVIIPSNVISIGAMTFDSCSSLTNVKIPDSVTSIGDSAFGSCSSLTHVTIPDSVTSIGNNVFSCCSSLTNVAIPGSVTSIGYRVFYGCSSLESVTIPDSVTSIGGGFFENCCSLTSVTIPDSVTSIGQSAFFECESISDVYFLGTEEEWNEIYIGNGNDSLLNATIHFNSAAGGTTYTVFCDGVVIGEYEAGETVALPVPEGRADGSYFSRFFTWEGEDVTRGKFGEENETSNGRIYTMVMPEHNVELTAKYVFVANIDGDKSITSGDLAEMKLVLVNGVNYSEEILEAVDLNGDGSLTSGDVQAFKEYMVGKFVISK